MKKLQLTVFVSLIVITIPFWAWAQTVEYYRYYYGQQVTLEVVPNRYMLVYDAAVERSVVAQITAKDAEQLYRLS